MGSFELIELDDSAPLSDDDQQEENTRSPLWLGLPLLVVVGLLFALSRGAGPPEETATPETTTPTTAPSTSTTIPPEPPGLIDGFADQMMLSGGRNKELVATDLVSGQAYRLGVVGRPLLLVDEWLIYETATEVMVLDLINSEADSVGLVPITGDEVIVAANRNKLHITNRNYGESFSDEISVFNIGRWDEGNTTSAGVEQGLGELVGTPGEGVYEVTSEGNVLRSSGWLMASNRDYVVTSDCVQAESECTFILYGRSTWAEVSRVSGLGFNGYTDVVLADEGTIGVVNSFGGGGYEIVDFALGESVDLDINPFINKFIVGITGVTDEAMIVSADDTAILVDRSTGVAVPLLSTFGVPIPDGVLAPRFLPYVGSRTSALVDTLLLESFAGQVLLTGGEGIELAATDIATGSRTPLGITGRPLAVVAEWFVFVDAGAIWTLDLSVPGSEPQHLTPVTSLVAATASTDLFFVISESYGDTTEVETLVYEIGSWAQPFAVLDEGQARYWIEDLVFSPQNGTFEYTTDGLVRRAGGLPIDANANFYVSVECGNGDLDCGLVVRGRDTWDELNSMTTAGSLAALQVLLVDDLPLAIISDHSGESIQLVDLLTGDSVAVDVSSLGMFFVSRIVSVSDDAVLVAADEQRVIMIDRVTGAVEVVDRPGANASPGISTDASLPWLADQTGG